MVPTWCPPGPHVGPMNLAFRVVNTTDYATQAIQTISSHDTPLVIPEYSGLTVGRIIKKTHLIHMSLAVVKVKWIRNSYRLTVAKSI